MIVPHRGCPSLAVLSVLSCQKEEQQVIDNTANAGANLITCTFASNDAATKTTLDGMTPKWAVGDEIVLYNSENDTLHFTIASSGEPSSTQGIIDESDATKFTFARPDGWENVYAIYPSSACVNSYPLPNLKFSEQDGTFAKANICAAAEISQKMSFKNVGAILKFPSKPEAVTNITIKALGSVRKNYSISFDGATPSLTPAGNTTIGDQSLTSKVDLFGWVGASSTVLTGEATKYGISTNTTYSDYGDNASDALKADWGTTIDNNGTWKTLSKDEWSYLLNTSASSGRTDANRFAKAKVSGVPGLIIFPDGYNGGTAITGITGVAKVNNTNFGYPSNSIEAA